MATFENCRAVSMEAGVDLTGLQHHFCIIASDGQVDSGGTTLTAQGVVDGIVGEEVSVVGAAFPMILPDGGIAKVVCGGNISAGGLVATDAAGAAIALGASNGNLAWGRALEAGASGRIIEIQFTFKGQVNA